MPRGKTGKAPQPEKARTSAPAEEKGPSALSTERFGKEDAAAQGSLLRRRAMKRSLGGLFLCPGARGSRKRKKALRQAVPAKKHPGNALLSAWAV